MKSSTFYDTANPSQGFSSIINSIENTKPIKLVNENNVSKEEKNIQTALTNNPNAVILEKDKVNTFCYTG